MEVISDYMGAMFKHAIAEIVRESLDPDFLDSFQKRFILTVPAVSSDKAKSLTLRVSSRPQRCRSGITLTLTICDGLPPTQAAQRAGIFPVEMITEPEAAALVTLLTVKNKGLRVRLFHCSTTTPYLSDNVWLLQESDAIIICDAGGGTVDLVAYEVDSVNPLKLRALTAPSGASELRSKVSPSLGPS